MVAKRSGVTEPFTRDKIVRGVQRACQGRPVSEDKLAILAQQVEETIRARGLAEVPSHEVGLAILGPLRDLDEVAYLQVRLGLPGVRVACRLRGRDRRAAPRDATVRTRKQRPRAASAIRRTGIHSAARPETAWQGSGRDPRRGK